MRVIGIVMREVDESALIVPDVLAMYDQLVPGRDGHALADVDVVVYQERLRRAFDLHDEALMRARRSGVVGKQTTDDAVRRDLDSGLMPRVSPLDRRASGEDPAR
jgi:hypothetical protein